MYDLLNTVQLKNVLFSLTNLTEELVILLDHEFTVLYINSNAVSAFGWNIENVVNHDFRELCLESNVSFLPDSLTENTIINKEHMLHGKTIIWKTSFFDFSADTKGIILLGKDITLKQKLARQNEACENKLSSLANFFSNLHSSQKHDDEDAGVVDYCYRNIIKQIPIAFFWKDLNGIYLGCSDYLAKYLMLKHNRDIIGKSDHELFPKQIANQLIENDKQVLAKKQPMQFEEIVHSEGVTQTFISYKAPFKDDSGSIMGIIGISVDFTQQKLFEKSLLLIKKNVDESTGAKNRFIARLAEQVTGQKADSKKTFEQQILQIRNFLEMIISCMPGLVYWKNQNGVYLGCNENLAENLGLKNRHEVIGKTDYELFDEIEAENLRINDAEVMASGKIKSVEEKVIMVNGNLRVYITNKVPLYDDAHTQIIGILGISLDITDLKNAEQKLREAKELAERTTQAKSYFLATMSHELRTPLNGILGLAQVLIAQNPPPEQIQYIQAIEQSGKNLLTLINDVLDFSRLEAGQLVLRSEKFALKSLMEQVVIMMSCTARDKNLGLNLEVDPNIPEFIKGDEDRLRQILVNLVGNAVKFTSQGHVSLVVKMLSREAQQVEIEFIIEDTGIGIPEDKLTTIFERFTQVESEYGRRFEGSGLGLAIVKNLVELMGGEVAVDSVLGKGSTFNCRIPFVLLSQDISDKSLCSQPAPLEIPLIFDVNILVVEDNLINQTVIRSMLSSLGCKVDIVSNGKDAITRFQKNEYDLVFMDLGLPDMDGLQVTKALLALQKEVEHKPPLIVALTAHVMEVDLKNCINVGMSDILTKPIMRSQLIALLKKVTKSAKKEQ